MTTETPLDRFKAVLGGAARAIAHEPEIELAFTADAPTQSGKHIKVPMPARDPAGRSGRRGARFRRWLRAAAAPPQCRAACEAGARRGGGAFCVRCGRRRRVEALGARGYAGIAANLATALDLKLRADPITRARNRDEVPLSTALGLMVRERLTGAEAPAVTAPGMALVRDWIEEQGGADLDALALAIDDQRAFASLAYEAARGSRAGRGRHDPRRSR